MGNMAEIIMEICFIVRYPKLQKGNTKGNIKT